MGAGVALRRAPQLWLKPLERSLMQRASAQNRTRRRAVALQLMRLCCDQ